MHLRFLLLSLSAAIVFLGAQNSHAQNTQNPDASLLHINGPINANVPASSPSALNGQNSDLSGLQPVNKYPVPKTVTFASTQSVFWTDNAYLTNVGNKVGSFGYNGRLSATYVPYSTYDWTPSISFEQQFIRYDHTSSLDFNAQTLRLANKYDFVQDKSWSWTAAYSLQRFYTGKNNEGQFYSESLLENEIDYLHTIFDRKDLFFLGSYNIGWRLTDPDYYSQVDNTLLGSIIYVPTSTVRLQAYGRASIAAYTDNIEIDPNTGISSQQGRTDYNLGLGLLATYIPCKYCSLSANFNWLGNYSNLGDREYRTITPALTLSGSIGW